MSRPKIVFSLYKIIIGKFYRKKAIAFYLCIFLSLKSAAYCADLNLGEYNSPTIITKVNIDTIKNQTEEFSENPTWKNQLFRDYDDRQCYKFSWLVNSFSSSDIELVNRNIDTFEVSDKNKAIDKIENSNLVEKKPHLYLAFSPNKKGHSGITKEALKSIEQEVTGRGSSSNRCC